MVDTQSRFLPTSWRAVLLIDEALSVWMETLPMRLGRRGLAQSYLRLRGMS